MGSQAELDIAAKVMCILHGERFRDKIVPIYVSTWLRDKLWDHLRSQYCKAWFARFPPDLWQQTVLLFITEHISASRVSTQSRKFRFSAR